MDESTAKSIILLGEEEDVVRTKYKGMPFSRVVRSLTRLAIGGLGIGYDGLVQQLHKWETDTTRLRQEQAASKYKPVEPGKSLPASSELERVSGDGFGAYHADNEKASDLVRYAMVGMIFDAQERLGTGIRIVGQLASAAGRQAGPLLKPVQRSKLLAPARSRFNRLVARGEQEVDRWVEVGRQEDDYGRDLAETAFYGFVDNWIHYFAEAPEVVDLVTAQSMSFAGEVVEEVRERTVSADNFLEGVVRTLLRRPSRSELSPPSPAVRSQAIQVRQVRNRTRNP